MGCAARIGEITLDASNLALLNALLILIFEYDVFVVLPQILASLDQVDPQSTIAVDPSVPREQLTWSDALH